MAASASRTVKVRFTGDSRDLERANRNAVRSTGETERGFLKLSTGLGKFKAGLGKSVGVAALAGAAAGVALGKAVGDFLDTGAARAKLAAQLGLTKTESAAIGKSAGELYAQNYGENLGQVNDAIRAVITDIDGMRTASQADLKDISGAVLNLSAVFGLDLAETTRTVSQLMRTGLAPNAKAALDLITRGEQVGADKAGDLLDTLNEYPTQFRKLGLSGDKALGLISQGLKAGARDSDIVADALKEFSIRAVDGSKLTAQGFKSLGLDASRMAATIGRGGQGAASALDTVLDRLRAIPDPVQRSQAAVALFGTQAEDLGAALFALDPSKAVDTLGKVGGAADAMGKTLSDNDKNRIESFKRSLQVGVGSALSNVIRGFNEGRASAPGFAGALQTLGAALKGAWTWIVNNRLAFEKFGLSVTQILLRVAGYALKAFGTVYIGIGKLLGIFAFFEDKVLDVYGAIVHGAAAAFGWIPGLGDKLKHARDDFDKFHATVNGVLEGAAQKAQQAGQGMINMGDRALTAANNVGKIKDNLDKIKDKTVHVQVFYFQKTTGSAPSAGGNRAAVGGFSHGGRVTGGIPGRDSVPALLTPGEVVLNEAQQSQLRRLLGMTGQPFAGATAGGQAITVELVSRDPLMQALLALIDVRVAQGNRATVAAARAGTGRRR